MSIHYTPDNTFIFCFVRMNPPTPGHLSLIGGMINKALDLETNKIFILTSSTMNGKNPVPCSEYANPVVNKTKRTKKDSEIINKIFNEESSILTYKKTILENMIESYKRKLLSKYSGKETELENLKINVICSVGNTMSSIYKIIQENFIDNGIEKINLIFFGGRDRADFADQIIDGFLSSSYIYSVDGEIMGREGMGALKETGISDRNVEEINESEYSASFVRNLVKNGDKENFSKIYSQYLNPEEINKLYDTIEEGLNLSTPSSSGEDDNPPTKYFTDDISITKTGFHEKKIDPKTNETYLPIINKKQKLNESSSDETINGGKKTRKTKRNNKKNKRKTKKNKKSKSNKRR